jgi:ribosomal protein L22
MAVRGGGGRCVVNSRGRELFYSSIKKTNSKSSLGPSSSSSSFLSTSSSSSTTTETSSSASSSSSSSSLPLSSSSSSSSPSYSISEVDPSTIRTRGAVSVESHLRGKRGFLSFPGGLSPLLRRVNASLRSVKGHTKKLSPVARLVTGMGVSEALAQLAFSASSRASAVTKVIERAIIKADLDHGLKRGDLVVEAAWTGKHVSYPRLRHHAKGRGGKSFKRTSQVSVSLREKVDEEKKKTTKKIIMKSGEEVLNTTTLMGGGDGGVKLQVDVRGY